MNSVPTASVPTASEIGPTKAALLIVDVQEAAVALGPLRGAEVVRNIGALAAASRTAGLDVIYVQHDGAPGEDTEPGTPGWPIHAAIAPRSDEVVVRKRFNSAFRETDLRDRLVDRGVDTLVLTGVQTEYCVDTTCRVAFEYGFRVIVPDWGHTTYDNGNVSAEALHALYTWRIWDARFAQVLTVERTLDRIRSRTL